MRFKRIIALLLVFAMIIPTSLIHAADLVLKEDANIVKQTPSGLTDLEDTIDVTNESYEAEIIVTSMNGMLAYSPQSVQLSIVEDSPVGKRIVGNTLLIDQGAPAGTITIKAVLPDDFYTIHTMTVNSGGGNPQPAQPRIAHTLLNTSDLNHLIISATALDDGIHNVQIRTFYKNASGMVGGDIVNLTREGNSSVFSADFTDKVSSKMRDSNAYEMTYFFTMLDENEGFLQYPQVIDMNSLEGALTVKLADAPDNGSGEPELDITNLIAKINEAKDLYSFSVAGNGFGEYPGEVMDAFNTAIEAASQAKDTATTQAQIDAAYQDLMGSISAFKADAIKGASRSDLMDKYDEAIVLYWETPTGEGVGQYPQQAKEALFTAILSVESVLNNPAPPQEEIDNAYQSLSYAIKVYSAAQIKAGDPARLQVKIDEAWDLFIESKVGEEPGQYPEQAYSAFLDAISVAEEAIRYTTTQKKIDEAYIALSNGMQEFLAAKNPEPDKTELLQAKINEAQRLWDYADVGPYVGQYPAEAKDALGAAIYTANEGLNNSSTEAELDAAYQALNAAITTFKNAENKRGDATALKAKADEASNLLQHSQPGNEPGQYPPLIFTMLDQAIGEAELIIMNSSTQAEIDEAYRVLVDAVQTFLDAKITGPDKKPLQDKIAAAESFLNASVEGTKVGQYPAGSKDTLRGFIDKAFATLTNLFVTQMEVDEALTSVNDALADFKASVIKAGDHTALQAAIIEAKILLEGSTEGNAVGEYPLEAMDLLASAITDVETLANEEATQAAIDTAILTLNNAVAAFEAAVIKEGNSTELQLKIEAARNLLSYSVEGDRPGEYPSEAFDALDKAVEAAETLIDSPGTQQQIDDAHHDLVQAIVAFENAKIQEGDYAPLLAAISESTTLYEISPEGYGAGQYWPEVKALFMTAIEAANVVAGGPSTQEEIEEALQTLADAVEDFQQSVVRAGDSTNLQSAITELTTLLSNSKEGDDVGEYPAGSKAILQAAVTAASNVISEPATQHEIDQAYEDLVDAADIFIAKIILAGDNSKALDKIHEVGSLLEASKAGTAVGEYPAEAIAALEAAFDAAVIVVDKPSSQVKLDAAYQALVDAVDVFKKAQIQAGDTEEADAVVTEAGTLLKDSIVGEGVGEYPLSAKTALEAAIAAAKEVLEHPATQAQIDTAKATLEVAITTFKNAVNKEGDSEEAGAVVTEAGTLLKDSVVGEGVGEYPLSAKTALEAAIAAAKEVLEHPATQAQIDTAKASLEAAITAFEAAVNKEGSSEEADAVVSEAGTLLRDSIVGEGVGEYPLAAKTTLEAAIAAAKEVLEHPATQAQIDEAKATLEAAITAFEAAVNKEGSSEEAGAVVIEAEALLVDVPVGEGVGQYPSEAVDVLKAAITAAKEVFEHPATQAQINEAKATLEAAITAFEDAVNKEGDSEEAGAVVTEAEALLVDVPVGEGVGQYPLSAKTALEAAIAATKEVLKHPATQAQIDAAKATLEAAITTFEAAVNKEGDSEEAGAVVTEAEALMVDVPVGEGVGQYPSEAVDVLKAAIKAAKEVFEHPATQAQIDEAKATLEAAIKTFEAAVNKEGSSEEAGAVVTEAEAMLVDVPVGEGVGEYPSESVDVLKAAIQAAKEVLEHPATQAQIDTAKATLEAAVAAFEAAVIQAGNAGEIQAQITEATTLLNESTEGNGVGQYPAGSKAILQAAIMAAENVIRTAATQAEIDKANEQLTAAYTAFRAAVIKTAPVDSYTPPVNSYTPPAATQPGVVQPSIQITDGLNTVETGQGTVKTAASEVQEIMKAAKPVILESTLGVIYFGKNGLNVPELKLGLGASLELGILMTEKSKTDEVLAGAKLDQAGLHPLGGKVLDLIAQLNYSNGTSTRIKSFAEPVKVTINLKELGLTGDTTNLTAVRFVPQADGTYKTIKLGGVYNPATNSFEFYTDSFSLYSIVKADSVTKITFKVDSKEYSIGALAKQNDVPPVIQEQRTLVPIRAVAEALGAEVKWDHATKTATITLDGKVLTMTLGELIEGMDVPAQAIDGRIMVPLRYVSEALGAYVMWFPQDKRIEIIR